MVSLIPIHLRLHVSHAQGCIVYHVLESVHVLVQVTSVKVDPIIRGGIRRFTDMIGQLWGSLSDYYIRAGHFEKVMEFWINFFSLRHSC